MSAKHCFVLCCLFFFCSGISTGQNILRLDNTKISAKTLDQKISSLMQNAHVHGLAVSVFNKNKPVYQKSFGYKNARTKELFTHETNMYGASLSKPLFAAMVMQLVEKGIIDLDKPLQDYLPKPIYEYTPTKKWHDNYQDLKEDSTYRKITARMCLAHTSGFPNWRWDEPDQKLRVKTTPGSRYSYSGEGLVYLQVVLEHLLDKPLEQLMQDNIFKPLKMNHSSYTWQPQFETDYCVGHNSVGEPYEKDKDNDARAASTLETTLQDYTLFTQAILNNQLMKKSTLEEMFTQQIRIKSTKQFGPLRWQDSDENDAIDLGYGLGWVLLKSPYGTAAFKEGHGDGFQHYAIIFPKAGIGMIIMSNSDNAEGIFKELLEKGIADTYTPWKWENYIPYDQK